MYPTIVPTLVLTNTDRYWSGIIFSWYHLGSYNEDFRLFATSSSVWVFAGIFVFNTIWSKLPCKNLPLYQHNWRGAIQPLNITLRERILTLTMKRIFTRAPKVYEESGYRHKSGFPIISHSLWCVSNPTRSVCREKQKNCPFKTQFTLLY